MTDLPSEQVTEQAPEQMTEHMGEAGATVLMQGAGPETPVATAPAPPIAAPDGTAPDGSHCEAQTGVQADLGADLGAGTGAATGGDSATDGPPAEAATGPATGNTSGATSGPVDYGDFGFGPDAHIDRNSDDYRYYSDLFRELGLSPDQAHRLLAGHREYAGARLAAREQQEAAELAAYRERVRQDLVNECGGEAQFRVFGQTALRGFRACAAGAGLSQADADGIVSVMGDDPRFVKIFHHIGRLHQEDVLVAGAGGGREQSFDEMLRGMFGK